MAEKKQTVSSRTPAAAKSVKKTKKIPRKTAAVMRPSSNPLTALLMMGGAVILVVLALTVVRQQRTIHSLKNELGTGKTNDKLIDNTKKESDKNNDSKTSTTSTGSSDTAGAESAVAPATLFFLSYDEATDSVRYAPVKRKLNEASVADAMAALIKGPDTAETENGLITTIPKDLKVRSVNLRGDTLTIDLSSLFLEEAFGDIAVNRINQVFMTVTQFSNISSLIILVEGRPLQEIDGRVIDWPMTRRL